MPLAKGPSASGRFPAPDLVSLFCYKIRSPDKHLFMYYTQLSVPFRRLANLDIPSEDDQSVTHKIILLPNCKSIHDLNWRKLGIKNPAYLGYISASSNLLT